MLKLQHTWSSNVQYTADVQVRNAGVPHFGETPMVMAQASPKGHMLILWYILILSFWLRTLVNIDC